MPTSSNKFRGCAVKRCFVRLVFKMHIVPPKGSKNCTQESSVAEPKLFVSASAPAPTFKKFQLRSDFSFVTTCLHSFYIKRRFFKCFLGMSIDVITCFILFNMNYDFLYTLVWPGARAKTSLLNISSGSGQKFWLLAAPAPQHCKKDDDIHKAYLTAWTGRISMAPELALLTTADRSQRSPVT
jgi:hypothetical protein